MRQFSSPESFKDKKEAEISFVPRSPRIVFISSKAYATLEMTKARIGRLV
jgi:hypothetical protein